MTLTGRAADRLVSLAAGVTRLPGVAAALAAGRIDVPRAAVFADELAGLDDVTAAAIAAVVGGDAAGLTTSRLRDRLHREVLAFDPQAARKRREKAQQDARVECWAEPSGAWSMAGRDMPPAGVLAADRHLDADARALKAAGAAGTLAQLRAAVFLARLNGQSLDTLLPAPHQHPGRPRDEHPGGGEHGGASGPGHHDSSGGDGGPGSGGPGSGGSGNDGGPGGGSGTGGAAGPGSGAGLTATINLTVPLATWLGLSGHPGEAAGYGHLDAAASRDLATNLAASPRTRWQITITRPDGTALGHGTARKGRPPPPTGPPSTGPPGSDGGDGNDGRLRWLAGIKISWLETGTCGHPRETTAYQPSPALRTLTKTRDRTCSYPGCRWAAERCDDDHTIPYDQGGRTCECNLAALCRRHHGAKQAPGWHLQHHTPGTLTWTLPSGRTHIVTPRSYPV